jgi:hypothetical protein
MASRAETAASDDGNEVLDRRSPPLLLIAQRSSEIDGPTGPLVLVHYRGAVEAGWRF